MADLSVSLGRDESRRARRAGDATDVLTSGGIVAHVKQYELVERIGEGGMGWVYRAWDRVLEREVALKVMKPDVPPREQVRFRQEALYGAKFCHPAMVRVYDLVGVPGQGISWFAMEYLPGRDMENIIERTRRRGAAIPYRLIADVFRQVLGGLQYAHDCKVVHRDVKPANMFVTRDPNTRFVTTKVLDFGVALDQSGDRDPETFLCGDPRYMAPEQSRLNGEIDGRADIYAAGISLYEIVTGRHPFEDLVGSAGAKQLVTAHRERDPGQLSAHLPSSTPVELACGLDVVFTKACAKDPRDRFESAADMAAALRDVFSGIC